MIELDLQRLAYKPHAGAVIEGLRALYERGAGDRVFASMAVPSAALAGFRRTHPEGFCAAPDLAERIGFWEDYLRERAPVEDDSIPSAYLSELDQGLYGGLVGGEVRFLCDPETGWISSMVPPLLSDWAGFDGLRLDEHHAW